MYIMIYSDPKLEQKYVAALIQLDKIYALGDRLSEDLVYNEMLKEVTRLALSYHGNYGERIVWDVVAAYLTQQNRTNEVDMFQELWQNLENLPVLVEPGFVVDTLHTYKHSRQITDAYEAAQELFAQGHFQDAQEMIYEASIKINDERHSEGVDRGEFLADVAEREEHIQHMIEHPEDYQGVPTGINVVDQHTGGTWPGEFCVVFGESSAGKSMALSEIARTGYVTGNVVLVITIEMKKMQWERRLDARTSQVRTDQFKLATLTAEEYAQWKKTLEHLSKEVSPKGGRLFVSFIPYCSPDTVASEIDNCIVQGFKPRIVIVDYLNMMTQGSRSQAYNESQQLGNISRGLKAVAGRFNVGLWTAAQKKTTSYRKGEMDLDDMGYSMQVVHVADTVLGMTYYPDTKELDTALLKQRDGRAFVTEKVLPDYTRATLDTSRLLGAI